MLIDALQMGFGRVHFRKGTEPRGTLHKHACVCVHVRMLACMCVRVRMLSCMHVHVCECVHTHVCCL